ncbi:MAG TPA: type 1 glutamine amidotransferase domain-containing protein [Syntrophales bacterium]|nr:type 1 glutamine amidotransferase domain-containing protein [Syntrophales bacterium]
MEIEGKRIVLLVEDRYQVLELWYPLIRLREAGAVVTVAGPEGGKVYKSAEGYEITADVSVGSIRIKEYDAIIVPGGYAPDLMRRNPAMVGLVKEAYNQGKVVAAICHAGWILASAGIVRGKRVTSFYSIKDDMINAGANWLDEPIVCDGRIITSRKPEDLPFFCREIIAALSK